LDKGIRQLKGTLDDQWTQIVTVLGKRRFYAIGDPSGDRWPDVSVAGQQHTTAMLSYVNVRFGAFQLGKLIKIASRSDNWPKDA